MRMKKSQCSELIAMWLVVCVLLSLLSILKTYTDNHLNPRFVGETTASTDN